jgi:hypothetical protein
MARPIMRPNPLKLIPRKRTMNGRRWPLLRTTARTLKMKRTMYARIKRTCNQRVRKTQ